MNDMRKLMETVSSLYENDEQQIVSKVTELQDKYEKFGFDITYNYGKHLKDNNKVAVGFINQHTSEITPQVFKGLVNELARDIKEVFDTNRVEWQDVAVDKHGMPVNHRVYGIVYLK